MTRVKLWFFVIAIAVSFGVSGCGLVVAALPMSTEIESEAGVLVDNPDRQLGEPIGGDTEVVRGSCRIRGIVSPSPTECARAVRSLKTAQREEQLATFCISNASKTPAEEEMCRDLVRNLGGRDDDSREPFNVQTSSAWGDRGRRGHWLPRPSVARERQMLGW